MSYKIASFFLVSLLTFVAGDRVSGEIVTFEQTATGFPPTDDANQFNPYAIPGGTIRFFFDANGNNTLEDGIDQYGKFELVGESATDTISGFLNGNNGVNDDPINSVAGQLGNWFLRQPESFGSIASTPFIIKYNTTETVTEFSGEIWDIDGNSGDITKQEQWLVEALNSSGNAIASLLSPRGTDDFGPDTLNGRPWEFGFSGLTEGVDTIRISFVGTKTSGLGLAFNNFSPTIAVVGIPEPSAATLCVSSLVLAIRTRRRARQQGRTNHCIRAASAGC